MDRGRPDIGYLEELVRLGCKSYCEDAAGFTLEFFDSREPSKLSGEPDLEQMRKIVQQAEEEALYGSS